MRGNGTVGRRHRDAEQLLDLGAVLVGDRADREREQLLLHARDVLVRVDPADLGVDARELGRVTARERRVGAVDVADLEDLAEAGRLRHLLEELRALREVGGLLAEVLEREQLGVGLGCRRHQLGGVDLDEVALDPPRAHRVLEGRLHPEDEVVAALAQVEEAPVHALVLGAVGGDRRLGQRGGGDLERADLDLDAAELDALVVLELAVHGEEGAGGQRRDRVGEREGVGVLRLGPVDGSAAGRVAGFTSCTAPVSSRRMTNCTFF